MATRDYTALKADIGVWMERDDLGPQLETFIEQAEDVHRFGLEDSGPLGVTAPPVRVRDMLHRVELAVPNGNKRFLDLPSDPYFLEQRRLRLLKNNRIIRLTYTTPENLPYTRNEEPRAYTVHEQIEFDSDAAEGNTFELLYYAPFPRLSDAVPTNWLLTEHYSVYLSACLILASVYVDDSEGRDEHLAGYSRLVGGLNEADRRGQQPRGRLQSFNTRVDNSGLM